MSDEVASRRGQPQSEGFADTPSTANGQPSLSWSAAMGYEQLLSIQQSQHSLALQQKDAEVMHLKAVLEHWEGDRPQDEQRLQEILRKKDEEASLLMAAKHKELELLASLLQLREQQIEDFRQMCDALQTEVQKLRRSRRTECLAAGRRSSRQEATAQIPDAEMPAPSPQRRASSRSNMSPAEASWSNASSGPTPAPAHVGLSRQRPGRRGRKHSKAGNDHGDASEDVREIAVKRRQEHHQHWQSPPSDVSERRHLDQHQQPSQLSTEETEQLKKDVRRLRLRMEELEAAMLEQHERSGGLARELDAKTERVLMLEEQVNWLRAYRPPETCVENSQSPPRGGLAPWAKAPEDEVAGAHAGAAAQSILAARAALGAPSCSTAPPATPSVGVRSTWSADVSVAPSLQLQGSGAAAAQSWGGRFAGGGGVSDSKMSVGSASAVSANGQAGGDSSDLARMSQRPCSKQQQSNPHWHPLQHQLDDLQNVGTPLTSGESQPSNLSTAYRAGVRVDDRGKSNDLSCESSLAASPWSCEAVEPSGDDSRLMGGQQPQELLREIQRLRRQMSELELAAGNIDNHQSRHTNAEPIAASTSSDPRMQLQDMRRWTNVGTTVAVTHGSAVDTPLSSSRTEQDGRGRSTAQPSQSQSHWQPNMYSSPPARQRPEAAKVGTPSFEETRHASKGSSHGPSGRGSPAEHEPFAPHGSRLASPVPGMSLTDRSNQQRQQHGEMLFLHEPVASPSSEFTGWEYRPHVSGDPLDASLASLLNLPGGRYRGWRALICRLDQGIYLCGTRRVHLRVVNPGGTETSAFVEASEDGGRTWAELEELMQKAGAASQRTLLERARDGAGLAT